MKKLLSQKIISSICLMLTVFAVSTSLLAADYDIPSNVKHVTIDTLSEDSFLLTAPVDYSVTTGETFDTSKYLYWRRDLYSSKKDGTYSSTYYKIYLQEGYDSFIVCNYYSEYVDTLDEIGVYLLYYNSVTNEFSNTLHGYSLSYGEFKKVGAGGNAGSSTFYIQSNCKIYYSTTSYFLNGNSVSSIEPGTLIVDFEEEHSKKIVYEITYDENNKKAQINASIKNASEGDTLYYSTLGFKLNGKLLNPHEISQNDISYIPVSENGLIHLQALDAERQYYRYGWY